MSRRRTNEDRSPPEPPQWLWVIVLMGFLAVAGTGFLLVFKVIPHHLMAP